MKWFVLLLAGVFYCFTGTYLYASGPGKNIYDIKQLEALPSSLMRDTNLVKSYYSLAYENLYKNSTLSTSFGHKALQLAQNRQWDKGKLLAYNVLCYAYYINGDLDVLMELATENIKLAQQQRLPELEAEAYRFVAHAYTEYSKFDSAYSYYQKALSIIKLEKNDSLHAAYHESLGSYYRDSDNTQKAIFEYNRADSLFRAMNSTLGIAFVTLSHGYTYIRTKEFSKAIDYFNRALFIFDRLDLDFGRLSAYNDLANSYYRLKKFDQAISNALEAENLADKFHSPQQKDWALTTLYRCYRDMGDLQEALRYMEELNHNRRDDFDASRNRRFTLFQLLHENERKDVAIRNSQLAQQRNMQQFLVLFLCLLFIASLLLWRKNLELRKKNKEINEALVKGQTIERKRVAVELHDTLGGTIAAINWYMHGIKIESLPKAEQQIYDRLQDMITGAYQEIRTISHNYFPKVLEQDGLVMALQRLIEKLNQNNQIKFTLGIRGMDDRPNIRVEFELYSTVLELANNILKHAEASHAYISLKGSKNRFTLTIADDGKGFDEAQNEGMGLRNVHNRVESLGGNLVITNEKNSGTFIRITIPRNQETFA